MHDNNIKTQIFHDVKFDLKAGITNNLNLGLE